MHEYACRICLMSICQTLDSCSRWFRGRSDDPCGAPPGWAGFSPDHPERWPGRCHPPPVCHPARVSSRRPPFCLVSYFQQLDRSGRGYSHTTSPCLLPRPSSCFDFFVVSESIPLSDCLGGKALLEASHTFKPVEPLAISRLGGYSSVGRASRSQ